jgi:hypothetical protein
MEAGTKVKINDKDYTYRRGQSAVATGVIENRFGLTLHEVRFSCGDSASYDEKELIILNFEQETSNALLEWLTI